ncbi:MAG: type VI secretion system-associated protein TagF [Gammaproteobacteria bacterium]|nr:type VI secretion system-associated protein TagF [Gammaproteobacteria bacterium]
MTTFSSAGFYGKIPSLGDFVNRRLPKRPFVETWDSWLQSAIAQSQNQLGEDWLNIYLTSPIWRFALSENICGPNPWLGIMIPSVDKVGRYFPLTIAVSLPRHTNLLDITQPMAAWLAEAESLALTALEDSFDFDHFDNSIENMQSPIDFNEIKPSMAQGNMVTGALHFPIYNHIQPHRDLAKHMLDQNYGQYSIWWTNGSELIAPSFSVCKGLPAQELYSALLDGNWMTHGWHEPVATS